MRKLLTSPAILFKGSGWAKKDARESRNARAASGTSSEIGGAADKSRTVDSTARDATAAGGKSQAAKGDSSGSPSATEG
jgi:hypothetical protein